MIGTAVWGFATLRLIEGCAALCSTTDKAMAMLRTVSKLNQVAGGYGRQVSLSVARQGRGEGENEGRSVVEGKIKSL